jgi:glyoxylase-like metal-dependent hydrolase (beta-lactamase superfamily II)
MARTKATPKDEAPDVDDVAVRKPLVPGVASALSPLVRRIVAPNPGMMTGPGTNTYLVGIDEIVVVDPGPDDAGHLDAVAGCGGDRIRWIVCTHTHPDHSPGAAGLRERTGAEVLAYDSRDDLAVDRPLSDGDSIEATEFVLRAVHTPGHASNHLCFVLEQERLLFSGDHIMEGSTVVISPPDGDMAVYLESLEKVRALRPRLRTIAPGHGYPIDDPAAKVDEYVTHRQAREAQVLAALPTGRTGITIAKIVEQLYADVPEQLHPVAAKTVWAHLRKLADEGKAKGKAAEGRWRAVA